MGLLCSSCGAPCVVNPLRGDAQNERFGSTVAAECVRRPRPGGRSSTAVCTVLGEVSVDFELTILSGLTTNVTVFTVDLNEALWSSEIKDNSPHYTYIHEYFRLNGRSNLKALKLVTLKIQKQ